MAAIARAPAGRAQGHGLAPGRSSTRGDLSELEDAAGARGRFLKGQRCPRGGSGSAGPGRASHTRLSSVLQKVAQLESKVLGQKKQLEVQNAGSGLKALPEEGTSSCSSSCSSGHEGGAKGRRCWRKSGATRGTRGDSCSEQEESIQSPKRNVPVKQQLGVDSEEEEMRELLERSLGFSRGNGNQKVLDKGSEGSVFGKVNSPSAISRNLAGHTRSSPLASSMKDNTLKVALPKAGCSKQRQESLGSDRSEIKSLDELFSEGADAEDAKSSSSEDFRLNILSLDDLASGSSSEAAELKQRGKEIEFAPESNKDVRKDTLLMGEEQAAVLSSAVTDGSDSPEEDIEKCSSEAEISEHLSGASSAPPSHSQDRVQQPDRTPDSQYSEDFESSVSSAEEDAESCPSPAAAPGEPRGQRGPGRAAELPPPPPPPPCSSCGARANPSAAGAGASPVDPVPIATALLSTEAPEALSSPQALLLHSLCKQHLLLTQHFILNVQQLHSALLQSLDREEFHYHSLEEAKEYIRNHKSPPLTMEQALEEIQRSQEKELNWK